MPDFNLDKLADLAPLVYGTVMEAPSFDPAKMITTGIIPTAEQWKDAYAGYLLVQQIRKQIEQQKIETLTEKTLTAWILGLHKVIARHAYQGYLGIGPGAYTDQEMVLHPARTPLAQLLFRDVLEGETSTDGKFMAMDLGLDIEDYVYARIVLTRVDTDFEGDNLLAKIQAAYQSNQLSEEDKDRIEKFVKLCPERKDVPDLMQRLIGEILSDWKACARSPADTEAIVDLVVKVQKLTIIHPFANANGRLATALINIILHSLGRPNVLLRIGNEGYRLNSPASLAFQCMAKNPLPLKAIIRDQLQKPYQDADQRRLIETQVALADVAKMILKIAPQFDVDSLYNRTFSRFKPGSRTNKLEQILAVFNGELKKLSAKTPSVTDVSIYMPAKKQRLESLFQQFTQLNNWKAYYQDGACYVVYDGKKTMTEKEQQNLFDRLTDTDLVTATKVHFGSDENHRGIKALVIDEDAFERQVTKLLMPADTGEATAELKF